MTDQPPPIMPNATPAVLNYVPMPVGLPFVNQSTGLKVFGIVLIIFGAIAGCFAAATPLGLVMLAYMPTGPGANATAVLTILGALLVYASIAAAFIWTGIGSIRAQRWVRPVIVTCSALGMYFSVLTAVGQLTAIPTLQSQTVTVPITTTTTIRTTTGSAPPTTTFTFNTSGMWIGIVFSAAITLIFGIPGLFFWFYCRKDTFETLQYFDPCTRWTDGLPLPVLGVVITAGLLALATALGAIQEAIIFNSTVINTLISVLAKMVAIVVLGLAMAWSYRLKIAGWYAAIVAAIVLAGAQIFAISVNDVAAIAKQFDFSGTTTTTTYRQMIAGQIPVQIAATIITCLASVAYLLWCRRYYAQPVSRPL